MKIFAYHITFGTYGTRLDGDPRGTVDRTHNTPGTPALAYDEHRWEREKQNLKFSPVIFTRDQMCLVESLIPGICERGYWTYLACAAGPDHVHVLLHAEHPPDTIRRLLKRWLSQELTQRLGDPHSTVVAPWFAECGSTRWIDNESYLANAIRYVMRQRATV